MHLRYIMVDNSQRQESVSNIRLNIDKYPKIW